MSKLILGKYWNIKGEYRLSTTDYDIDTNMSIRVSSVTVSGTKISSIKVILSQCHNTRSDPDKYCELQWGYYTSILIPNVNTVQVSRDKY